MAGLTCFFLFSIFLVNNVLSRPNPSSNPSPSPSSTTVVQMRSASLDPEYEKDVLKECARVRLEVEEVPEGKREEVLIKKYAMERVDHEKTKEDKNSAVKDKGNAVKYLKRNAVLYFYRVRFDRLQSLLELDREVAELLAKRNSTGETPWFEIPDSIPSAGRNSYSKRYRIWNAIYTVMGKKPDVKNKKTGKITAKSTESGEEIEDFVYEVKLTLERNGIDTGPKSVERNTAITSAFFNKLSEYAKQDDTKIDWDDEDDVIEALKSWKISHNQVQLARVIFQMSL